MFSNYHKRTAFRMLTHIAHIFQVTTLLNMNAAAAADK